MLPSPKKKDFLNALPLRPRISGIWLVLDDIFRLLHDFLCFVKPYLRTHFTQKRTTSASILDIRTTKEPDELCKRMVHMNVFLRRDSPPKSSTTFSVRPRSSVGRVTVDLIRRSWVRFPPRSNDFFFTSCGSLIPFTRANAQWVIHGFN